ncbi:MAG: hypothetical protein KJ725_05710 [Gammaproteobacteria bacterium]|nr:hypothetical protein [Gammaproteobacteria bacterium]
MVPSLKVAVTGASGFVGKRLVKFEKAHMVRSFAFCSAQGCFLFYTIKKH